MLKRIFPYCIATLFVFSMLTGNTMAGFFGQHKKVKAINGEVLISMKTVKDGKAHYYVYSGEQQEVKFFVVKSADGVIRAAFDACDVCFHSKKGYTQDGDFMICNNCGRKFHSNRINVVQGGCNPAPLTREKRGENLVITVNDILQGARYF
jgi:uncharacterized membrane protein